MADVTTIDIAAELTEDSEERGWGFVCTPPQGA